MPITDPFVQTTGSNIVDPFKQPPTANIIDPFKQPEAGVAPEMPSPKPSPVVPAQPKPTGLEATTLGKTALGLGETTWNILKGMPGFIGGIGAGVATLAHPLFEGRFPTGEDVLKAREAEEKGGAGLTKALGLEPTYTEEKTPQYMETAGKLMEIPYIPARAIKDPAWRAAAEMATDVAMVGLPAIKALRGKARPIPEVLPKESPSGVVPPVVPKAPIIPGAAKPLAEMGVEYPKEAPIITPKPIEIPALASGIFNTTLVEGGSTFHLKKGNLKGTDAFAVGIDRTTNMKVTPEEFRSNPSIVTNYLEKYKERLSDPNTSVGTWLNKETGQIEFDIVETPKTFKEAFGLAKEHDQDAIYDLKTGREISVMQNYAYDHYSTTPGLKSLTPESAYTAAAGAEKAYTDYPEFKTKGVYLYPKGTTPEHFVMTRAKAKYPGTLRGALLELGTPEHKLIEQEAINLIKSKADKYGEANETAMNAAFQHLVQEHDYDGIKSPQGVKWFKELPVEKEIPVGAAISEAGKEIKAMGVVLPPGVERIGEAIEGAPGGIERRIKHPETIEEIDAEIARREAFVSKEPEPINSFQNEQNRAAIIRLKTEREALSPEEPVSPVDKRGAVGEIPPVAPVTDLTTHARDIPDVNNPDRVNYWKTVGGKEVYYEGWCDKCLAGTGFPKKAAGGIEAKIDYIRDLTPGILERKAKERGLTLIRGDFVELPDAKNLYGATIGVFEKTKPTEPTIEPPPETKLYGGLPETEEIVEAGKATIGSIKEKVIQYRQRAKELFTQTAHPEVELAKDAMLTHVREGIRDSAYIAQAVKGWFEKKATELKLTDADRLNMVKSWHDPKAVTKLPDTQRGIISHLNELQKSITHYLVDNNVLDKDTAIRHPDYLKGWWIDPKTGEPFSPFWGRFAKGSPMMKEKTYPTHKEAIEAGMTPATTNLGELVGMSWQEAHRIVETRKMFSTLNQIESITAADTMPRKAGAVPKPLRVVESWSRLGQYGKTEGYIKYDHPSLEKTIAYKDIEGELHLFKGAVGVRKELFPFVKAYMENPNYGTMSHLNFAVKTGKMTSGFHIISLTMQGLAAGERFLGRIPVLNVVRGLKEIEKTSPDLRLLNKCGLDVFNEINYADIGRYQNMLYGGGMIKKAFTFIPREMTKLTFDVVHRGLSVGMGLDKFRRFVSEAEGKLNRPLTEAEKINMGYKAVDFVNNTLSGTDVKSAMLHSTEWMAKYWYDPTARKAWQLAFLSPSWQRAHIAIAKEIVKSIAHPTEVGASAYRGYVYGALGVYAMANLYNYIMTKDMDGEGKYMFQNANPWAIRMPWNNPDGSAVYGRVLKSIFEIPEVIEDPLGRAYAKLSPALSAGLRFYKDKLIKSNADLAKDFAKDLLMPMGIQRAEEAFKGKVHPLTGIAPVVGVPVSASKAHSEAEVQASKYMRKKFTGMFAQTVKSELRKEIINTFNVRGTPDTDTLSEKAKTFFDSLPVPDKRRLFKESQLGYLESTIGHLNVEEALDVYKQASPEEKARLGKHIIAKIRHFRGTTPEEREDIIKQWEEIK